MEKCSYYNKEAAHGSFTVANMLLRPDFCTLNSDYCVDFSEYRGYNIIAWWQKFLIYYITR